ncbi:MAG: ABC transporter permease [Leptospirillia bacterium]
MSVLPPAQPSFSERNNKITKAKQDLIGSFFTSSVWMTLGWLDIRQRYRRSALGPWWITLSLAITVLAMGILYAKLFRQDIHTYLPFLAVGMVFWTLMSSIMNDGTKVFIEAEGIIKQIPMAFGIHVLRMLWRHLIVFFHNMVVVVAVLLIFGISPGFNILLFPLVVLFIGLNGYWVGIVFGILGTRFRDVGQIVASLVQILFFITPVMWSPSNIVHRLWIMEYNPLFHVLAIARNSLSGGPIPIGSWLVVVGMTLGGWVLAFQLLVRYRGRIAYWL